MYKFILSALLGLCMSSAGLSQAKYGREDCQDILGNWINLLQSAKETTDTSMNLSGFNTWVLEMKRELNEKRFNILDGKPNDQLFQHAVVNILHGLAGSTDHPALYLPNDITSANSYYEKLNELPFPDKRTLEARQVLFALHEVDREVKNSNQGMDCPSTDCYFTVNGGLDEQTQEEVRPDKFYKYLLDLVEYNRDNTFDEAFYRLNYKVMTVITGVEAPEVTDLEGAKKYVRQFSKQLLTWYGRYVEEYRNDHGRSPLYSLAPYEGRLGGNRYAPGYYKKLLKSDYQAGIQSLIDDISHLKDQCAGTSSKLLGRISASVEQKPILRSFSLNPKIAGNNDKPEPGMVKVAIAYRNSKGTEVRDKVLCYRLAAKGSKTGFVRTFDTYSYFNIPPGHYKFYFTGLDNRDSIIADLHYAGEVRMLEFAKKGALAVAIKDHSGASIDDFSFNVYQARQNANNSLQIDTAYLKTSLHGRPIDLNPGTYLLRLQFPANYMPRMSWWEFDIGATQTTQLTVGGYGQLVVNTLDGKGAEKKYPVDLYTVEKNSKTKERTFLRTIQSYDTLNIRPGSYRLEIRYPVTQIIESVEVDNSDPKVVRFEKMGSLRVTNNDRTREYIDIINSANNQQITTARNDTPIDLPTDIKYTIKVNRLGGGSPRVFYNVELQAGQEKVITWK